MSTVTVLTDEDKLAERLALRIAQMLPKMMPEIFAAQAKTDDREVSTREAARIAKCRPDTIGQACQSGKLKSRTTARTTPSGASHRLIRARDIRAWIDAGMPT